MADRARLRWLGATAGLILVASAGGAVAQRTDALPGADLTFSINTGPLVSSNYERVVDPAGTSSVWSTDLDLGYLSQTEAQRLFLRAGTRFDFGYFAEEPEADQFRFDRSFLRLDYSRQNRHTRLRFDANLRANENGFDNEELEDGTDLIVDQGTQFIQSYTASLELGRASPLSFTTTAFYQDRRYFDTTDPGLNDQTFWRSNNRLAFALNRTTDLTIDFSYSERDTDDSVDTFETRATAGIGFTTIRPSGLRANATLSTARNETERTVDGQRVKSVQDSPLLNFSLQQPRPNGTASLTWLQDLNDTGRRTQILVGRRLEFPSSTLSVSLGISGTQDSDQIRGIGDIAWRKRLPQGALTLSMSQRLVSGDFDDDTNELRSSAALSYVHELSRLAQIRLRMDYSATEAFDANEPDRQRARFEFAYSREVSREWSLNAGVRHFTSRETNRDPIIENEIFANISRRFNFNP